MSVWSLGLVSFGERLSYVLGFLGMTKVGSLLHRYLCSHFGVDCWFVRARGWKDRLYDGWNPGPERGATWRPILVHVAFHVDPLAQPGTVILYLGANRGRGHSLQQRALSLEDLRCVGYISAILRNHVRTGEATKRVGVYIVGTML